MMWPTDPRQLNLSIDGEDLTLRANPDIESLLEELLRDDNQILLFLDDVADAIGRTAVREGDEQSSSKMTISQFSPSLRARVAAEAPSVIPATMKILLPLILRCILTERGQHHLLVPEHEGVSL